MTTAAPKPAEMIEDESGWVGVTVEADPLGDVNKIVRLHVAEAGGRMVFHKAGLCPINAGDSVRVGQEPVRQVSGMYEDALLAFWQFSGPTRYFAEVGGRRIVEVLSTDLPRKPMPRTPLQRRLMGKLRRVREQLRRRMLDPVAHRLGYIHDSEATW